MLPEGGADNVSVVFGDDINGELSAGFRGDYGRWVSDMVGLGGRFWILAENNDSYFAASDGSDALAANHQNTPHCASLPLYNSPVVWRVPAPAPAPVGLRSPCSVNERADDSICVCALASHRYADAG